MNLHQSLCHVQRRQRYMCFAVAVEGSACDAIQVNGLNENDLEELAIRTAL